MSDNGTQPIAGEVRTSMATEGQGETEGGNVDRAQRLLIFSLAVTLEKMQDRTGPQPVDELIGILHDPNFSLPLFKALITCRDDCKTITEDIINRWKNK